MAARSRVLGPQHPDTLRGRANLLLTLRQRGINGPAAERQQVIAELAELLGDGHPDVTDGQHQPSAVRRDQPAAVLRGQAAETQPSPTRSSTQLRISGRALIAPK